MVICSKCGKETREGNFCAICGEPLNSKQEAVNTHVNQSLKEEQNIETNKDIVSFNNNIETQNTQQDYSQYYNNQQPNNQYTTNQQANNQQQYNTFQQNNPNVPLNQKNKIVGLILNIFFVGLGYAYVGKWGEGLVILFIYILLWAFSFLIIPIILAIGLWVYTLIKTNDMIDKYNQGLPY